MTVTPEGREAIAPPPATAVVSLGIRQPDTLIAGALFALPLLVLLPVALVRGVFYLHDLQFYFYPYHALTADLLWRGELPLWNPYAFSGMPLMGDGQTALFYPPNWLFFVLPGAAALNYDVLAQFSIAGAGMYLLARDLAARRLPAIIGALAFMFCGFLTARVVHLSIQSGAALIPLVFLCVGRAFQVAGRHQRPVTAWSPRAGRRWFAAAAGAVGLQAMAGHPQVPVYTALALGLFAVVHATARWRAERDPRWLYRYPLRLAGIYGLGYALAAIQLAPWVELGRFSPRAAGASFQFVFENSMNAGDWLLLLFPYLNGSLRPTMYAADPQPVILMVRTWEHSAYVGLLPLGLAALALLGAFKRPNVHTVFFGLLLLGAGLFAAGRYTPLGQVIYQVPVVGKLRDVERAMALFDFALAGLAALGAQRLLASSEVGAFVRCSPRELVAVAAALVLVPVAAVLLLQQPRVGAEWRLPPEAIANLSFARPNVLIPLLFALLGGVLLVWWSRRPATPLTLGLAAAVVLLDVGSYAAPFNALANPRMYSRRPESLAAFSTDQPFRKATMIAVNDLSTRIAQETLAVSWAMAYGVEDINGFNSLQTRRYTDYLFHPQTSDVSYGLLDNRALLRRESPILSALNVRYVLVAPGLAPPADTSFLEVYRSRDVRVYENLSAYPRAYFADTARTELDPRVILRTVTADHFDGRRLALLETDALPELTAGGEASLAIQERSANRIVLTTATAGRRLLVLSEMYYPGWRATIDGVETPIFRTNYLFRSIAVPAGQHHVVFEYRPGSLLAGAAISLVALAACGLMAWTRRE